MLAPQMTCWPVFNIIHEKPLIWADVICEQPQMQPLYPLSAPKQPAAVRASEKGCPAL